PGRGRGRAAPELEGDGLRAARREAAERLDYLREPGHGATRACRIRLDDVAERVLRRQRRRRVDGVADAPLTCERPCDADREARAAPGRDRVGCARALARVDVGIGVYW